MMKNLLLPLLILFLATCQQKPAEQNADTTTEDTSSAVPRQRWTVAQAQAWQARVPWQVGTNFIPSTAINQLEMWQAETFDPETIDRELSWAASLGMNSQRVFLHNLLWEQDSTGFLQRIDQYLQIADRHGQKTMFVLFDGVWDPAPQLGTQRDPKPHTHNSGWMQGPGAAYLQDTTTYPLLERYVKGIIKRYANDQRVVIWDLFNEPDNINSGKYDQTEVEGDKELLTTRLLEKTFMWAREARPSQPLTAGVWRDGWFGEGNEDIGPLFTLMLNESDILSFHSYSRLPKLQEGVEALLTQNRPVVCTEYMARPFSTFEEMLPYFKEKQVHAYNWGLVDGKTQTKYPWRSWRETFTAEPEVWHHDIFREDGTPYNQEEVAFVRQVLGAGQ